jgi:serine/threonine protein kinase
LTLVVRLAARAAPIGRERRGLIREFAGTGFARRLVVTRRRTTNATTKMDTVDRAPQVSRLGTYNVIAPIARGGTSGVFVGEHVITKERVALKVLDPFYRGHEEVVTRLLAEHRVSIRVRHAGLVDVLLADRGTDENIPYLVMEYLDGESLGALFDRGQIELDAIMAIGAQIAGALSALHAGGVVHCDIKPDNVFVLYDSGPSGWPRVKVIDFGVARFADEPNSETTIAGTPCYMAPEQWRGAPTEKSDVYAFGCMLYELVTGDQPFHGTLPQLMLAHHEWLAERPSVKRSDLPAELELLIVRAMAKDPSLRPTMSELEVGLRRLLGDQAQVLTAASA